jgi:hypothetical protein
MIGFQYDPEPPKMDHIKNQSQISSVYFGELRAMVGFYYELEPPKMDHLMNQSQKSSDRSLMSVSNIGADQTDNPNIGTHCDLGLLKAHSQKNRLT